MELAVALPILRSTFLLQQLQESTVHPGGIAMSARPHVVIIGGGFGGLSAAQALKHAPVDITLIDRRNFHLFQPLLYQVATGSLSPGEIAAPLRGVLSKQKMRVCCSATWLT
jgi:NADPH-dependent 2,4-dienoyl-CoA reductase/sulfur reductase-like enzyme